MDLVLNSPPISRSLDTCMRRMRVAGVGAHPRRAAESRLYMQDLRRRRGGARVRGTRRRKSYELVVGGILVGLI